MSQKKMTLFYIIKMNTSKIMENGCKIKTTFKDCKQCNEIISVGDNQLLGFIRRIKDKPYNKEEIDSLISDRNYLKRQPQSKINSEKIIKIQNEINEKLFVPDLITVKVDTTKKDYKHLCKNGLEIAIEVNGNIYKTKYRRLCAGAGQLRRNSAMFVNEEIYDQLELIMMCGLTRKRIGKINLAKFGAYFSLYTSATNQVTAPNICVVKDFEYDLKNQVVDWIYEDKDGELDIEKKNIAFTMNAFDGSGMISPRMAEKWQNDLSLDYIPSSFIIRSAWLKGLVSVFDFHKFAKEVAGKTTITDAWGKEKDVENIDVILTTSQFKMWKKYSSWEEYIAYHKRCGQIFGVARVNKKESNFMTTLNYQYIQSNNFTDETIKKIADPTINWLQSILNGNPEQVYAYTIGKHPDKTVKQLEDSLDTPIAKCLLYNQEILKDDYVKKKIQDTVQKKIEQAKIGKIYVEGSYDFIVPDLYAMAEHAFGMEVKGLLPAKCMYSKRWVDKGSKKVSMQRSPLVASAENQVMNVYSDDRCKEWFSHMPFGNILSIWDLTVISMSDKRKLCPVSWQHGINNVVDSEI